MGSPYSVLIKLTTGCLPIGSSIGVTDAQQRKEAALAEIENLQKVKSKLLLAIENTTNQAIWYRDNGNKTQALKKLIDSKRYSDRLAVTENYISLLESNVNQEEDREQAKTVVHVLSEFSKYTDKEIPEHMVQSASNLIEDMREGNDRLAEVQTLLSENVSAHMEDGLSVPSGMDEDVLLDELNALTYADIGLVPTVELDRYGPQNVMHVPVCAFSGKHEESLYSNGKLPLPPGYYPDEKLHSLPRSKGRSSKTRRKRETKNSGKLPHHRPDSAILAPDLSWMLRPAPLPVPEKFSEDNPRDLPDISMTSIHNPSGVPPRKKKSSRSKTQEEKWTATPMRL